MLAKPLKIATDIFDMLTKWPENLDLRVFKIVTRMMVALVVAAIIAMIAFG